MMSAGLMEDAPVLQHKMSHLRLRTVVLHNSNCNLSDSYNEKSTTCGPSSLLHFGEVANALLDPSPKWSWLLTLAISLISTAYLLASRMGIMWLNLGLMRPIILRTRDPQFHLPTAAATFLGPFCQLATLYDNNRQSDAVLFPCTLSDTTLKVAAMQAAVQQFPADIAPSAGTS